jgi:2-oxoglutarate dehydrogenase E1 component
MMRQFRKPLVIMTPKSLLRNKDAGSPCPTWPRAFQTVIPKSTKHRRQEGQARRRLLGQGLLRPGQRPQGTWPDRYAIIRVEQLYPFPHKAFAAELKKFPNANEVVWARTSRRTRAPGCRSSTTSSRTLRRQKLAYAGRPASASPAVGYYDKHYAQQKALLETAFAKLKGFVLTK